MVNAKKIHIRTVTVERVLVQAASANSVYFCAGCEIQTEMVSLDQASASTGISMRDLFRLSERKVIHSVETDSGQIIFCRKSLNEFAAGR